MVDHNRDPISKLLNSILSNQRAFNDGLKPFMDNVILPILLKDTSFKRHFLAAPAVAVSFNLLQQIYEACFNFLFVLSAAEKESGPKVTTIKKYISAYFFYNYNYTYI
jgi:hypothetical protein